MQEQENRDILERFRTAHSQAEDWEAKLQQVEGLNSSIRLELLSTDTERRHLRERLAHLEREIQEVSDKPKMRHIGLCLLLSYL